MNKSDFSYKVRIQILKDEKFFGEGVASLLEHVDATHSLLQASKNMSMAYTKSLQIIKRAENALGFKLLVRKTGGASGGGSQLTQNAEKLLALYDKFKDNVSNCADKEFNIFINKMGELE